MVKKQASPAVPAGLTEAQSAAYTAALSKHKPINPDAKVWKPTKVHDFLVGGIVSIGTRHSQYGIVKVVTLADAAGTEHVLFCGRVLTTEFDDLAVQEGEEVMVVYCGRSAPKPGKGRPAELYSVVRVG